MGIIFLIWAKSGNNLLDTHPSYIPNLSAASLEKKGQQWLSSSANLQAHFLLRKYQFHDRVPSLRSQEESNQDTLRELREENLTARSLVPSLKVPPYLLTPLPRLSLTLTLEFSQASLQRQKFIWEFPCPFFNHPSNGFPNPELLPWISEKMTDITLVLLTFLSILMTIMKGDSKVRLLLSTGAKDTRRTTPGWAGTWNHWQTQHPEHFSQLRHFSTLATCLISYKDSTLRCWDSTENLLQCTVSLQLKAVFLLPKTEGHQEELQDVGTSGTILLSSSSNGSWSKKKGGDTGTGK